MSGPITCTAVLAALQSAAPAGDDWDAPEAAETRRLTGELGMCWDFVSWPDALHSAERGRLAGCDLSGPVPIWPEIEES